MWKQYNPNPAGRSVGDCSIRAVAKALNVDWAQVINGRKQDEIWPIMDELMSTLKVMNGRLYIGVLRKLSQ